MMREKENIDDLLIAYLLNELDAHSMQEIEMWLAESSENQKRFEEVFTIWYASNSLKTPEFNSAKAWEKVTDKMEPEPFYQNQWLRIAAMILVIFGASAILWNLNNTIDTTVVYAENEILIDTLVDGSVISLNKKAKISYTDNFNSKTREVKLEGEAFFDIERDTTKPFIIHLAQSNVKVLGTSFNIENNRDDKLVSVFVKSGVVMFEYLSNAKDSSYLSVELRAGDRVIYNKETRKLEIDTNPNSVATDIYWLNKQLVFEGIELGKVAKVLEAVYEVEISFSDEGTKKCLLTASFQNSEIDEIMEVISSTFELELQKTNKHYSFIGLSCEDI